MSKCIVLFEPQGKRVSIEKGKTLLDALTLADLTIDNLCGGQGTCGRCKMIIKKGEIKKGHSNKITPEEKKKGYVLACLAIVNSSLTVEIPEETLVKTKIKTDEYAQQIKSFDENAEEKYKETYISAPLVTKTYIELPLPTLENSLADNENLCEGVKKKLKVKIHPAGLKLIQSLPEILRKNDYKVTVTLGLKYDFFELINVEAGDTARENYMVVIDIGTTTIVAHLLDVPELKTIGSKACFNSQKIYGREVTSRIIASEKNGEDKLHKLLIEDINNLIDGLIKETSINRTGITAVICAGNTAMGHFLLNLPARYIRRAPYAAVSVDPPVIEAAELGININPKGLLYSLPGVAGWMGSDLTAGIIATEIYKKDEISLLVDIGTNGEVIIGNKEWLMATSASAGPALEGASMECGMRAEPGAIEKVTAKKGEIQYKTIGNAPAIGICGSGIIDLIAVLLNEGIINRSGKFIEGSSEKITTMDGIKQFTLINKESSGTKNPIFISEIDIEGIITAKAAIYAAIIILLKRLDLKLSAIERFYIAGSFGNFINIENAIAIGLVPDFDRDKIEYAGNTALKGSKMAALNKELYLMLNEIRKNTTYYDLMGADDYVEEFRKAMFLPHTDIEEFRRNHA